MSSAAKRWFLEYVAGDGSARRPEPLDGYDTGMRRWYRIAEVDDNGLCLVNHRLLRLRTQDALALGEWIRQTFGESSEPENKTSV